jgi:hypothetical protein
MMTKKQIYLVDTVHPYIEFILKRDTLADRLVGAEDRRQTKGRSAGEALNRMFISSNFTDRSSTWRLI